MIILPCDEIALDLAKSILFATKIIGRVLLKSISVNAIIICSAF